MSRTLAILLLVLALPGCIRRSTRPDDPKPEKPTRVTIKGTKQNISAALWSCITMCNYAYSVQNSAKSVGKGELSDSDLKARLGTNFGLTKVTVLRRAKYDTLAIVASNRNVVVVAFRGTEGAKNEAMNKKGVLRPSWKYVAYKGKHVAPPMIHHGWLLCMDDWFETLRDEVKRQGSFDKALFVTGHSLGGALASLFAQRFIGVKGSMLTRLGVHVLTFGAPEVGNQRFVDMYQDNRVKHTKYRIDHYAYYDEKDHVATRHISGFRRHGTWRTIIKPGTFRLVSQSKEASTAKVAWWSDAHDRRNYELAMKLRLMKDLPSIYVPRKDAVKKLGDKGKYITIRNINWPNYTNPKN